MLIGKVHYFLCVRHINISGNVRTARSTWANTCSFNFFKTFFWFLKFYFEFSWINESSQELKLRLTWVYNPFNSMEQRFWFPFGDIRVIHLYAILESNLQLQGTMFCRILKQYWINTAAVSHPFLVIQAWQLLFTLLVILSWCTLMYLEILTERAFVKC